MAPSIHRSFALQLALLLWVLCPGASAQAPALKTLPLVAVMTPSWQAVDSSSAFQIADALADELMHTGKVRVMERSQMQRILKEQSFQGSGACDGNECAVEVGRLLSINHMVIGTVGKLGGSFTIATRLVNVSTGEVEASSRKMLKGEIEDVATKLLPVIAKELADVLAKADPAQSLSIVPSAVPDVPKQAPVATTGAQPAQRNWLRWGAATAAAVGIAIGVVEHLSYRSAAKDADQAYANLAWGGSYGDYTSKAKQARNSGLYAKLGYGLGAIGAAGVGLTYAF